MVVRSHPAGGTRTRPVFHPALPTRGGFDLSYTRPHTSPEVQCADGCNWKGPSMPGPGQSLTQRILFMTILTMLIVPSICLCLLGLLGVFGLMAESTPGFDRAMGLRYIALGIIPALFAGFLVVITRPYRERGGSG